MTSCPQTHAIKTCCAAPVSLPGGSPDRFAAQGLEHPWTIPPTGIHAGLYCPVKHGLPAEESAASRAFSFALGVGSILSVTQIPCSVILETAR
jgi:hypothetical protein